MADADLPRQLARLRAIGVRFYLLRDGIQMWTARGHLSESVFHWVIKHEDEVRAILRQEGRVRDY